VLSLLGMLLIGLPFIAGLGIAAAATVAMTLLASITLLPALLGFAGDKIEVTRWRGLIASGFAALSLLGLGLGIPALGLFGAALALLTLLFSLGVKPLREIVPPRPEKPTRETLAYRWSRIVQARPWTWVALSGGLLLVLTAPVLSLRLGFSDEGNFNEETTTRQAYDLIAEGFGPGYNGPFLLAIEVDDPGDVVVVQQLAAEIATDPGVADVSGPFPSNIDSPAASEA